MRISDWSSDVCSSDLLHDGREGGGQEIRVVQNDVRAIQLGKAALYAGIRLLMDRLGVEQIDQIMLAGAFGSHIDTRSEEHTSELQSLMRISYAVFCLKKKRKTNNSNISHTD